MTSLVRTWTHSWNTAATTTSLTAQGRQIMRVYKDAIKLAGWTVEGSSNSSAAGMDGTDRWTADSNLVWHTAGSAHSWIVLKSPTNYPSTGKNIWLLIACSTGSGNPHLINLTWGSAAFTSGSTTADPTAPTNNKTATNQQFIRTPVVTHKYSYMYNTAGDFMLIGAKTGSGYAGFAMGSWLLSGGEASDTYPWVGTSNWNDSGRGGFTGAALATSASAVQFWTDDTVASLGDVIVPNTVGGNIMAQVTSSGSNISGKFLDFPAAHFSQGASQVAIRGSMVDLAWAPYGTGVVQGTVEPSSGSSTHTIIGDFWIPNGNTVPTF
jgi:hypothetical protein